MSGTAANDEITRLDKVASDTDENKSLSSAVVPEVSYDDKKQATTAVAADESFEVVETEANAADQPWKIRIPALFCLFFLTLGSNYADATLGPLKSTIREEVPNVSNARYGVLSSSNSLINAILPIISGIAIDFYGAAPGSIISSVMVLIGVIVKAIGGRSASFRTILAGEIIFGFGSTTIETCQLKLYSHWSKKTVAGRAGGIGLLAFVYGLDISWGRVFSLMGSLSAVPIGESSGVWYLSWWVGVIFCGVSLALNILYLWIERQTPLSARPMTGRKKLLMNGQKPDFVASIRALPMSVWALPAAFWVLAISQLLQAGAVLAYMSNLSEIIQITRSVSKAKAAYISSITRGISIAITPIVGLAFDFLGYRMHVVSVVAALWILVFSLIAYTSVSAYAPVVIGALALTANVLPFLASIPLLVNSQMYIGTAFGIWKALNSAGTTVLDVATGAMQDRSPQGKEKYHTMFYLLIALKAVDVFYGMGYHLLDKRYFGSVLWMSERQRAEKESASAVEADQPASEEVRGDDVERPEGQERVQLIVDQSRRRLLKPIRSVTIFSLGVGGALITAAYVVFIVYSF